MTPEKQRPIMSQNVVKSGSYGSVKGYLNEQEFIESVPKNYRNWAGLGFGVAILMAVIESFTTTYNGPFAPLIVALFGVIASYVKTMNSAKRALDEGEDIDAPR